MKEILKYFPDLTPLQRERFGAMGELYREWNDKINVISRKDIDQIYLHHILHSLAIARVCRFATGVRVADVGCGGGFPGIPLAVMFPEARFTLVDSIGKKIKVVEGVAEALGLDNVRAVNGRIESVDSKFDFVVSRAVTDMRTFTSWVWNKIERGEGSELPNGILYLKGGDLKEELGGLGKPSVVFDIQDFFGEEFFETKKIVYLKR